jgi:hypothetical protein
MDAPPREITTSAEFTAWLASTPGGDTIIYHTGFLARDTASGQDTALMVLANTVWEAAVAGRVYLTQGKMGDSAWAYMATAPVRGTKVAKGFIPQELESRTGYYAEYYRVRRERLKGETNYHA